jgi:hypothetical protein
MNCQKCKSWEEMYDRCENEKRALAAEKDGADAVIVNLKEYVRVAEQALRDILISHGQNGDGGNLDKFTRRKCLEVLQASDRRSNAELSEPPTKNI